MAYYLAYSDVPKWLATLAKTTHVVAPQREGRAVVYRPITEEGVVECTLFPTESAKHVVFPRAEQLFNFKRQRITDTEGGGVVELAEPAKPENTFVFGALPCDARGFATFDPVYKGSGTKGHLQDPYYLARRETTTILSWCCKERLTTCFCHWVGGAPNSRHGADLFAVRVEDGLVIEAVTEKGTALLQSAPLSEASANHMKAAKQIEETSTSNLPQAPDLAQAKNGILAHFDDTNFWVEQSEHCLSCGACTYLCPTCYCFNITDESNGITGVRLRSWDTCMASSFTLEASGHNPRNGKAARLKNRVGHKFSYYPELHEGMFSCVGCGRCIKSCPSSVDIRSIVTSAINAASKKEQENAK